MNTKKYIFWYGSKYTVTNDGIFNNIKNKFIKKTLCKNWYVVVLLTKNWEKKQKQFYLHRIMATAFIPNAQNKLQVNHKNGIRDDNRLENLEWCTQEENIQHAREVLWTIPKKRKVMQLTKEWILCRVYDSCYEAGRITGNKHCNIYTAAQWKFFHCWGYVWKFI